MDEQDTLSVHGLPRTSSDHSIPIQWFPCGLPGRGAVRGLPPGQGCLGTPKSLWAAKLEAGGGEGSALTRLSRTALHPEPAGVLKDVETSSGVDAFAGTCGPSQVTGTPIVTCGVGNGRLA